MSARRPSSARPTPTRRSSSSERRTSISETPRKNKHDDLEYECKVAYLMTLDDVKDDVTSPTQLRRLLQQTGRNPSQRILDKYWKEDTRYMTFTDFVHVCRQLPATTEDDLMKAFKKIDINGDGFISESEFTRMMTVRGEKMSQDEIRSIIEEADTNKDGKLDYREFCRMVLSTQDECTKVAKQRYERKQQKLESKSRGKHMTKQEPTGSQVSMKSTSSSSLKLSKKSELGSKTSLRSTDGKTTPKVDSDSDIKGSQVSLRSNTNANVFKSKEENRKFSPLLSDDTPLVRRTPRPYIPDLDLASSTDSAISEDVDKKIASSRAGLQVADSAATPRNPTLKDKEAVSETKSSDEDDDDIVVGSRVSLRNANPKSQSGSVVSLKSSKLTAKSESNNINGSQVSLRSTKSASKSDSDSSSPPKPKPRKRSDLNSTDKTLSDDMKASPRPKDRARSPSDRSKIPKPDNLDDWERTRYNGAFFVEDDGSLSAHQYQLSLTSDTSVWITINSRNIGDSGGGTFRSRRGDAPLVDTAVFVVKDKLDEDGLPIVRAFTEHRDSKGRYYLRCDLEKGRYQLLPFTTGCRLQQRHSQPKVEAKLVKKEKDKFVLSKDFKDKLREIFDICDLDGNGLLNRQEFSLFNLRTSGEEIADEEWDVVRDNVELKNEEVTLEGFIELNQMEAEENQGDTDDLWLTLSAMGFNRALVRDEATPFVMEVFAEDCEPHIKVLSIELLSTKAERAACQFTLYKGKMSKVKNMKDLMMHTWQNDYRGCVVVENKSRSSVTLKLDCNKSHNAATNRDHLSHTLAVKPKSIVVGHHLLPANDDEEMDIHCVETVIK